MGARTEQVFTVDGAAYTGIDTGAPGEAGSTVVLLHGNGGSWKSFTALIDLLAPHHRVVAFDQRGFGGSASLLGQLDYRQMADDTAAVLRSREVGSAVFVGISLGAGVLQALAVLHEPLVAAALFCCSGRIDRTLTAEDRGALPPAVRAALFENRAPTDDELRESAAFSYGSRARRDHPELIQAGYELLLGYDWTATAGAGLSTAGLELFDPRRIPAPSIVLVGDEDRYVSLDRAEELARELPDAELIVVPECGHAILTEALPEVGSSIERLLALALLERPNVVRILGSTGPSVLLLPGGAESADGFFPGLAEGLLEDPGCRVILHDRPGTGTNTTHGALVDASRSLHETVSELGVGPVILVGQSLGAAVAVLYASDYPDDVAGLVLLDASPVNDPTVARSVERTTHQVVQLYRVRPIARALGALQRAAVGSMARKHGMRPDATAAALRIADGEVSRLAKASAGLEEIARSFDEGRLPIVPAAVVSADRKPNHPMRAAHERLAAALQTRVVSWPNAHHAVHLTHPDQVLDVCRGIVRAAMTAQN